MRRARDLKAFVRNTFHLTPEQDSTLSRMTPEVQQKIVALINATLEQGSRFRMVVEYLPAKKPQTAPQRSTQSSARVRAAATIVSVRSQKEEIQRLQSEGLKDEAEKLQKEEGQKLFINKQIEDLVDPRDNKAQKKDAG